MTAHEPLLSQPMRPAETLERPVFEMPGGAVDAHMHIFGPLDRYPSVERPHYTLPDATLVQFRAAMQVLGLRNFVIVQPSFYDTDNRCLIDNLKAAGDIARGVVMVEPDIDAATLQAYTDAGVCGVRLDLFKRAQLPLVEIQAYILAMAAKVAPFGWHLQFYAPGFIVRDLIDFLGALEIDYVIDHMGYMLEEDGLTEADFARLLALMTQGRCWLKLSAPYRLAKKRGMDAVNEIAKTIVAAAPERAIWGSDWPHIPEGARDTGALLNLLAIWAPDPAVRKQILSDNPRKLLGFA
ncbi:MULTISPECIES: amidohydrolase family protein [Sphingobium]|uniref:Hydrolase n=1 Tax=Sphingobium cupriresistens LL01 TaxID=1420583 RepID=A0A0J7XN00_9SPHN|nr:amidohydrolase family protein [Sphingobium cupriresistens]KMS53346.1 hydrolase [Sphingobium cupriresistens LL01]MBJ7376096.1 amidohydrolase family protein [Sphingobium sp.]